MPLDFEQLTERLGRSGDMRFEKGKVAFSDRVSQRLQRRLARFADSEPGELDRESPVIPNLLRANAEGKMEQWWNELGGASSSLGIPVGDAISATPLPDGGFEAQFRGGTMTLDRDATELVAHVTTKARVRFAGVECQIRQEEEDEIYGTVTCLGAANGHALTVAFPGGGATTDLGKSNRIWLSGGPVLYEGPPEDLVLVGTLVEHDESDEDIEAWSRGIGDGFAKAIGTAVHGATGQSAEDVIDLERVKKAIHDFVQGALDNVLGLGDDPYEVQNATVSWEEINASPSVHVLNRDDDPKAMPWTHCLVLTGRDDGGDVGQYGLYFEVEKEHVAETQRARLPKLVTVGPG
jgi:hypothetical protein